MWMQTCIVKCKSIIEKKWASFLNYKIENTDLGHLKIKYYNVSNRNSVC